MKVNKLNGMRSLSKQRHQDISRRAMWQSSKLVITPLIIFWKSHLFSKQRLQATIGIPFHQHTMVWKVTILKSLRKPMIVPCITLIIHARSWFLHFVFLETVQSYLRLSKRNVGRMLKCSLWAMISTKHCMNLRFQIKIAWLICSIFLVF